MDCGGLLGLGAIGWIANNPDNLSREMAIGAYVVCSLIVLFSFLGCFAAIKESVCLTALCAVFLLILAILQIISTYSDMVEYKRRDGIVDQAWNRNEMDALQTDHQCCGKDSPQDYILLNKSVPASCYVNGNTADENYMYTVGCSVKLQSYYQHNDIRFLVVSWILIAFEILGFLLAVFLVINFRNKQRRMQF
ncbi:protein late bloomer-like [Teleopsis dalmanni]|uniref:protein late bloomer-like n=1 Tax=Teleopsis dalmanni TaxID=139649 RepID=UPI0018CD0D85|nr:protein late bloomer-like [Teleopsis dalmanni]